MHDTFPKPSVSTTMWISCESLELAQQLKKDVLLKSVKDMPVSAEYMDKDSVHVTDQAGRVLCHMLKVSAT